MDITDFAVTSARAKGEDEKYGRNGEGKVFISESFCFCFLGVLLIIGEGYSMDFAAGRQEDMIASTREIDN